MHIFLELSIIVSIALGVSLVMRLLKQPLIVGYIITGIIAGPYLLNVVHSVETIELFSKIGITMLLFIVGLHLSPSVIKEVGGVSLTTGLGQVIFTSLIGFIIVLFLGIDKLAAVYVAIALTFSGTIIVLKLLSDKGHINSLYGKISIGFLLVQDIVATIILIVISAFTGGGEGNMYMLIGITLLKGIAIIAALLFISSKVLTPICRYISTSQELLFLFSMAWGMGLAAIMYLAGFSVEIGALVAGVTLSATPYAFEIGSRMRPLRDFFIVLFFILLGSQMQLNNLASMIPAALILSVFVLIGNPIIVLIIMNLLGFNKRTGFMAGLTVAQISEFSLILATLGFNVGHLSRDVLSLVTLVGLITIAGSTYLILYAEHIYTRLEPLLKWLEFNKSPTKKRERNKSGYTALLFGYDRVGKTFVEAFTKIGEKVLVVDYNPSSIERLSTEGIPFLYGDAGDMELLTDIDFASARIVVSTIPDIKVNSALIETVRKVKPKAIVIVISHNVKEAKELYHRGASYVMMPHYLGATYAAKMISKNGVLRENYDEEREKHIAHIYKNYTDQ